MHWHYYIELMDVALFQYLYANTINIVDRNFVTILLLFKC